MIKIAILFLATLALVASVQSDCGVEEIQRLYNNFEEFRLKYLAKQKKSFENYDYSVSGDVRTLHVKIDGASLTENYQKPGDKIETIGGQLVQVGQKTTTIYTKVDNKFKINFTTPTGKVEFFVDSFDNLDTSSFTGLEKSAIDNLVTYRHDAFEFFNQLSEDDIKKVKSIETLSPRKEGLGYGKAVYVENGSENKVLVYEDSPNKYIGAFTCEGKQYNFKLVGGKIEDVVAQ